MTGLKAEVQPVKGGHYVRIMSDAGTFRFELFYSSVLATDPEERALYMDTLMSYQEILAGVLADVIAGRYDVANADEEAAVKAAREILAGPSGETT